MYEKRFLKSDTKKIIKYALVVFLINILISILYNKILIFYNLNYKANPIPFDSLYEEIFLIILVAPVFETLLYQFLPSYIFRNKNKIITIFVSSILFGLSHWYSFLNFIFGMLIGTLFIISYILIDIRKVNPLITICLAHMFYNISAFIWNHL